MTGVKQVLWSGSYLIGQIGHLLKPHDLKEPVARGRLVQDIESLPSHGVHIRAHHHATPRLRATVREDPIHLESCVHPSPPDQAPSSRLLNSCQAATPNACAGMLAPHRPQTHHDDAPGPTSAPAQAPPAAPLSPQQATRGHDRQSARPRTPRWSRHASPPPHVRVCEGGVWFSPPSRGLSIFSRPSARGWAILPEQARDPGAKTATRDKYKNVPWSGGRLAVVATPLETGPQGCGGNRAFPMSPGCLMRLCTCRPWSDPWQGAGARGGPVSGDFRGRLKRPLLFSAAPVLSP
jgi:hypothetical protein